MPTTAFGLLGLGFVLGLRHALDVDHLAAVSTLVSRQRRVLGASLVGAVWGLGHTAALLAAAVVVLALEREIPPAVEHGLETGVAVMLLALGLNVLLRLARDDTLHAHVHAHGGRRHRHPHLHAAGADEAGDTHHGLPTRRPFLVGLLHGLAGSAALMLSVLATIPSAPLALGYVAVFGLGSIGGMAATSALVGVPLAVAAERFARIEGALRVAAGAGSIAVGLGMLGGA